MVSGSCALPPRWLPQCSCVVIESSFDPGERLQAPGSLWLYQSKVLKRENNKYVINTCRNKQVMSYSPFSIKIIFEKISVSHLLLGTFNYGGFLCRFNSPALLKNLIWYQCCPGLTICKLHFYIS